MNNPARHNRAKRGFSFGISSGLCPDGFLTSRRFIASLAERPDKHREGEENGGAADDRKAEQPRVVRMVQQRVDRQRNEQSEGQHEDQQHAHERRIDGKRVFRIGREVVDDLQQRSAALENERQRGDCDLERGDDQCAEDCPDDQQNNRARRDRDRQIQGANRDQRDP